MTDPIVAGSTPKISWPHARRQPSQSATRAAARVMQRCDQLAGCTEILGEITRTFCSSAMHAAYQLVREWMTGADMDCRLDPATNLVGRYTSPSLPTGIRSVVIVGSHLDSIINAGKYDGPLGVLMGIGLVEMLREAAVDLPFVLEVFAFCEEEGVRFQTPYIGSRAMIGELSEELLQRRDAAGVALEDAIRMFGGDPEKLGDAIYSSDDVVAYLEPHIEQAMVLEQEDLPMGIVSGVAGQSRAGLEFIGHGGHAGTVPMSDRQDALATAAELIIEVERLARSRSGLVATIGRLDVTPNVANVIAANVKLSLDVRSLDDHSRKYVFQQIIDYANTIAGRRRVQFEILWSQEQSSAYFDPRLIELTGAAMQDMGIRPFQLPSGAGHDAVVLSKCFPTMMLFLRCPGGISHHPAEAVVEHDVAMALDVLQRLVVRLTEGHRQIGSR